jgi:hypothetical protein
MARRDVSLRGLPLLGSTLMSPGLVANGVDATDHFENGTVTVAPEAYTVYKTDRAEPTAFATVQDDSETTVVAEAGAVSGDHVVESEGGWRRLTFDATLPFDLVGFLAEIATALACEEIPIFVVSSYSTDHVFVKDGDLDRAIRALEALGCTIDRRPTTED